MAAFATLAGQAARSGGEAVLYGDTFLLTGSVQGAGAGRTVIVLAQPHGRAGFAEVGRTRTDSRGRWRYDARPAIRTTYRARVGELLTARVVVDVEPRLVLRGVGGTFTATARARRSFAGKYLLLQSRTTGPWRTVRRLVLDRSSAARFTFQDSPTRTHIRVLMPRSQVGPGYVEARSGVITLFRR